MNEIAYSEIWDILNQIDEDNRKKIPKKIINNIDNKRDKNFKSNITLTRPLINQKISEKAKSFLCYLNMEYWSDETEKEKLKKIYMHNQEEYYKSVDIDKVFESRKEKLKQNNSILVINDDKEKWYKLILNKIKKLLQRK